MVGEIEPIKLTPKKSDLDAAANLQAAITHKSINDEHWNQKILEALEEEVQKKEAAAAYEQMERLEQSILSASVQKEEEERQDKQKQQAELQPQVSAMTPKPKTNNDQAKGSDRSALIESKQAELDNKKQNYANYKKELNESEDLIEKTPPQKLLKTIDKRIEQVEKELKNHAKKVNKLLEAGDTEGARAALEKAKAKNIQIANLKDVKDVLEGKKQLYDAKGKQVYDLKEASFILNSAQSLKKGAGSDEYYLYDEQHKDAESAQTNFERQKPSIQRVRGLVEDLEEMEVSEIQAQLDSLQEERPTLSAMPNSSASAPALENDEDETYEI